MYTDTKTISLNRIFSRKTFYTMIGIFISMVFLYAYFLTSITVNTAEAKQLNVETKDLMSEIATLEVEYLANVNDLDMTTVLASGYVEVSNPEFAYTGGDESTGTAFVLR